MTLPRNRLTWLLGCVVAGSALGALAGAGAVGDIETDGGQSRMMRPRPAPVVSADPEPADPLAREVGYSIASAWDVTTLARCASLDPKFRAGCRDYVREQARKAHAAQP